MKTKKKQRWSTVWIYLNDIYDLLGEIQKTAKTTVILR